MGSNKTGLFTYTLIFKMSCSFVAGNYSYELTAQYALLTLKTLMRYSHKLLVVCGALEEW